MAGTVAPVRMPVSGLIAGISLALSAGLAALGPQQLPDQRGGHDSLAAHRGSPVVVVVVDARRLGTAEHWARDLMGRFPGLQLLTVADVNEARPATLERVAEVLARRVPPDAVVLIDMERLWARELGLDTAAPNLVLVDPEGNLAGQFRGRWQKELASEVASGVESMSAAP